MNPATLSKMQHAVRQSSFSTFQEYTKLVNDESRQLCTLRGLMQIRTASHPIPIEEVEPAKEIVKRFATGAMSYGSISKEAHETLAIAMNRIGGRSNTGEGGEDAARFIPDANGDSRRSAIKQVASGRFGVTGSLPRERRRTANQSRSGRQARRRRSASRTQSGRRDRPCAALYPWCRPDFAAAASRHLLHRRSGAVDLRSEER